jgi:hypothetical protein
VARAAGGRLVASGVEERPAPARIAWLAIVPFGERAERPGELARRWCADFLREDDPARRAAAARALAVLHWSPLLDWLGERWLERGDEAALEGLLALARRGGVPRALQSQGARARLWDLVLDGARPDRLRLFAAQALAEARAPEGGAEPERALRALAAEAPRAQHFTLVALEGWQGTAPALVEAVRATVARPGGGELEFDLRWQALRTARALGLEPAALELPDSGAFFQSAIQVGRDAEAARLLSGVGTWPPEAWSERPALEARFLAPVVAGWLARGRTECAARALQLALADEHDDLLQLGGERIGARAGALAGAGDGTRDGLREALRLAAGGDAAQAGLLAVALGVADAEQERLVARALAGRPPASAREWAALARLCAGPEPAAARARLLEACRAEPGPAADALRLALRTLRERGERALERELEAGARALLASPEGEALAAHFHGRFPPPWSGEPVPLARWDRRPAWLAR